MKIAVSADGGSLESRIDQRFGRARFFVVYDTESGELEAHSNQVNLDAAQGAGIQSAQNVAAFGADAVVTGHVGPNAFRALSAAGIVVYTKLEGTVGEAVEDLKARRLPPLGAADVEGHWA